LCHKMFEAKIRRSSMPSRFSSSSRRRLSSSSFDDTKEKEDEFPITLKPMPASGSIVGLKWRLRKIIKDKVQYRDWSGKSVVSEAETMETKTTSDDLSRVDELSCFSMSHDGSNVVANVTIHPTDIHHIGLLMESSTLLSKTPISLNDTEKWIGRI